jgi:thiosulfate/3-mercaptopyruvate sulfurtransferase
MKHRHGTWLLLSGLLATALLAGCGAPAAPGPSAGAPSTPATGFTQAAPAMITAFFVTAPHVQANAARSIVIDAREPGDYAAGHIPGAINVSWKLFADVDGRTPGEKGYGTLKSASAIAIALGKIGIDRNKQIVVYSSATGGEDGRIVWMLLMAGLPNSKMLEGGYPAWVAAGYEVSTEPTTLKATTVALGALNKEWVVTTAQLAAGLDTLKVIDARSPEDFAGATSAGEARGGHLPGAVSVPFESLYHSDGSLKSVSDVYSALSDADIDLDDAIVVYGTDGVTAADMTLILRGCGFEKSRAYDAGFYEWSGDNSLRVVK